MDIIVVVYFISVLSFHGTFDSTTAVYQRKLQEICGYDGSALHPGDKIFALQINFSPVRGRSVCGMYIRWCRFYYFNYWKYVEQSDSSRWLHSDLRPFEDLSAVEKEKNFAIIRELRERRDGA